MGQCKQCGEEQLHVAANSCYELAARIRRRRGNFLPKYLENVLHGIAFLGRGVANCIDPSTVTLVLSYTAAIVLQRLFKAAHPGG